MVRNLYHGAARKRQASVLYHDCLPPSLVVASYLHIGAEQYRYIPGPRYMQDNGNVVRASDCCYTRFARPRRKFNHPLQKPIVFFI
jgi:hypothetical protein